MRSLFGVYRAVCTGVDAEAQVLRCHVPQVFADETVTILDINGGLPAEGATGWVAFESGFPDRPVWMSTGGGGDGSAGGGDEVFVGSSDPGSKYELWYDTDAPPPSVTTYPTFGPEASRTISPSYPLRYSATDTKRDWLYDGTGWIIMAEPVQTYVPSTVNVTVGNGVFNAHYHRSDGWCDVAALFQLGSTSAIATGPRVTLPFPANNIAIDQIGFCSLADATGGTNSSQAYMIGGAMEPRRDGTQIGPSVPFVWTVNDYMLFNVRYWMSSRYT